MKTLRWGILGAAQFAQEQMAPAIHAAKGAELVALATSHPDKAAPFQAFAPQLATHSSYEALLADPETDEILRTEGEGSAGDAGALGLRLADDLLASGGTALLERLRREAAQ